MLGNRFNLHRHRDALVEAYRKCARSEKTRLLDELAKATGYHRKYLIGLLSVRAGPFVKTRKRHRPVYSDQAMDVAHEIWKRVGRPSSERLAAQMPLCLPHAGRHVPGCTEAVKAELSRISGRQLERRLRGRRRNLRRKTHSAMQRSRMLRHTIPVSMCRPRGPSPVPVEVDLVAHCGERPGGRFIWTLNAVDVATGRTCAAPVFGAAASHVVSALSALLGRLPFPAWGIHSDNGSEFINHHMVRFCEERGLSLTRSRPRHKNDNARVEQKNWTRVRRVVGYGRFDTRAQFATLETPYGSLCTLSGLFEANAKPGEKSRDGATVRRRLGAPATPLDRLVAHHRRNSESPANPGEWSLTEQRSHSPSGKSSR